jgi:Group II intron, maturase-specific domain
LNSIIKKWADYFAIGSYEILSKTDGYILKRCFKFIHKKFPNMKKKSIVSHFFLHKIGRVSWNFNVPFYKVFKHVWMSHVILIRICSMVKFISVSELRPYIKELLNPYIHFQSNGLWLWRISKIRYKFSYLNMVKGSIL